MSTPSSVRRPFVRMIGSLLTFSVLTALVTASATAQPPVSDEKPKETAQASGRGYLGVTADDTPEGLRITTVAEGAPARIAGLRRGDIIRSLNDRSIESFEDLADTLAELRPGTRVQLKIDRDGEEQTLEVTLAERKLLPDFTQELPFREWAPRGQFPREFGQWKRFVAPGPEGVLLGVETQPVTEDLAETLSLDSTAGALVHSVVPGSPAQKAGMRPSDLIIALNGEPVRSPQQLHEQVQAAGPRAKVQVELVREGKTELIEVTLAERHDSVWARRWNPDGFQSLYFMDPGSARRVEELEQRVRELERRIEELEQRLRTKPAPAEPSPN